MVVGVEVWKLLLFCAGGFAARRKRRKLGESQAISQDAEHRSGDAEDDFDLDDDASGDDDGSEVCRPCCG